MASNDRVRVRGVTMHRPVIYGNTAWALTQEERDELPHPDHTHRWTVAVRGAASVPDSDTVGGADDLGYFIKKVSFKLHDTYPNPNRNVDKPPFEVSETGWGEFEVTIRVYFVQESGEKAITFYHHLKLHPWTAKSGEPEIPTLENALKSGPVHSWQYDEIVFSDPFQSFLNILTAHPPTMLPKVKRRPVPFHTAHPGSLEASKGGTPEFQQEMEKEEAERIEKALKQIVEDTHKWRNKLIEQENESNKLKKELEAATQP
uniref:Protein AF-9 homolog n=1 Tax=Ganoderma boninense TaxID=34458 RepID=A0A5K1JWV5_9APHY|nr:N/A [Ganoderma boninense]